MVTAVQVPKTLEWKNRLMRIRFVVLSIFSYFIMFLVLDTL